MDPTALPEPRLARRTPSRPAVLAALVIGLLMTLLAPQATGSPGSGERPGSLSTVVALDYTAGEHPEGLAVAEDGSLYVGMAPTGQLARVEPEGHTTPLGAPAFPEGAGYLLGLAVDGRDDVYGAVVRFDGGPTGVWKYDRATSSWELFAATEPGGFPNGLAFTQDGDLLVADSTLGTIWRVDRAGLVSRWLDDEKLEGGANDLGVNGLAVDRAGTVWFTNFDQGTVGRVSVSDTGAAVGRPSIVAADPLLASADGVALDQRGGVWVGASYGSDRLLRVSRSGHVTLVADRDDGLDYTASLAFGRAKGTQGTLFFSNAGDDFQDPSVMSLRTGVRGLPLRYP